MWCLLPRGWGLSLTPKREAFHPMDAAHPSSFEMRRTVPVPTRGGWCRDPRTTSAAVAGHDRARSQIAARRRVVLPRAGVGLRLTDEMPRTTHSWVCLARRKCDKHYRGGKAWQGKGKGPRPSAALFICCGRERAQHKRAQVLCSRKAGRIEPTTRYSSIGGDQVWSHGQRWSI